MDLFVLYELFLERERAVLTVFNMLKPEGNLLLGFCWVPQRDYGKVRQALNVVHASDPSNLEMPRLFRLRTQDYRAEVTPPTHLITNEFTGSFQTIVNLFDVPQYKEMNPALFTCVSFPFLFGVMFGDICHGSILLSVGIILSVLRRRASEYELSDPQNSLAALLKARHLILLMGVFSTYCGFMYNDFASIPLSVFGTCYTEVKPNRAQQDEDCVSKTGIDTVWYLSSNELAYVNSMKMKIAVILGVLHMTLGIVLRGSNALHFNKKLDFLFEFLPQLIILVALFGYMDLLIIMKWLTDWTGREGKAPSIIQTMIAMFIEFGALPAGTDPIIGTAKQQ